MILAEEQKMFMYPFENENGEIRGTLITGDKQPVSSGAFICLSIPGKDAVFQYATTDSGGSFTFPVNIDTEIKDLIFQPGNSTSDFNISIESPFSHIYPGREISGDSSGMKIPEYVSDWSAVNQVRKIYEINSSGGIREPGFPVSKPLRFYGKPDEEIVLADYIKLPDMEEVFFEIVNYVSLKKKKSGYVFSMVDPVELKEYEEPPSIMIDGVIIDDPGKIAVIEPELVEKIDVVLNRYVVGDYIFNGIINVITKKGDGGIITLPEKAVRMPYRTVDKVWDFESPDYKSNESINQRLPDLRNTLYWNPSVAFDKEGKAEIKFWSGDIKSDYLINIQGITAGGKYVSAKKIIRIK
jgi:hypothetical protein